MDKRIVLIGGIIIGAVALIILSMQATPPEEMPVPRLPLSGGPEHSRGAGGDGPLVAPDFEVPALSGGKARLSDLKGKAVFLNFWSITCPPCRMEMPDIQRLLNAMKDKDFAMLAVTADSPEVVERFLKDSGLNIPVYFDETGRVHQMYGAYALPMSYIISPDGKIANQMPGAANWGDQSVIDYFNMLINEGKKKEAPAAQ